MRRRSVLLLLSVLVAACATPYQPAGLDGGYSHTRLNLNMFNVIFRGNAHTSWQTAENYALYRCAELTLESGFDYFAVLSTNSDASHLFRTKSDTPQSATSGSGSIPFVSVTIRAFKGERPPEPTFSARDVIQALAPSIKRD
jgi:hypothetical protein